MSIGERQQGITHNGATVCGLPHLRAFSLQITDTLTAGMKTY